MLSHSGKNWEEDVSQVAIEPCDPLEDPSGYMAVFSVGGGKNRSGGCESYSIGASYLLRRRHNLNRAGYRAPMTHRAIRLIEKQSGAALPATFA